MATVVKSFALQGVDAYQVDIEAKDLDGLPIISIIGMGDQAIKEAGERITAAIDECGYAYPKKKMIISLAPGDKKKSGTQFDLPMAVSMLQQSGEIDGKNLSKYSFIGELSLDGSLRGCKGVLPMVIAAKRNKIDSVIIPRENLKEAELVKGIDIYGFDSLKDVVLFVEGKTTYKGEEATETKELSESECLDFKDVVGQKELIDAVVLAAAGGHNLLMLGEPGCGKTMIASRIPGILPEMTEEECLEVTKIYSITGLVNDSGLVTKRPFRAPHHNASLNSLIGGGVNAMPGEVSLAHNGVMFLDELAEFSKRTLDALRQPIEDKHVTIARVNGNHTYPSNFMFIAAMNPCPCGFYPSDKCKCSDYEIIKYRSKISGPILDRIDIQKKVLPVNFFDLASSEKTQTTSELRAKVVTARKVQSARFAGIDGVYCNAQMTTDMIKKYCILDEESLKLLKETCEKYGYSARTVHKLLRLARTSADIDGREKISCQDVERVLRCRDLDKSNSELVVVK